jgi:hypothetical protein
MGAVPAPRLPGACRGCPWRAAAPACARYLTGPYIDCHHLFNE